MIAILICLNAYLDLMAALQKCRHDKLYDGRLCFVKSKEVALSEILVLVSTQLVGIFNKIRIPQSEVLRFYLIFNILLGDDSWLEHRHQIVVPYIAVHNALTRNFLAS